MALRSLCFNPQACTCLRPGAYGFFCGCAPVLSARSRSTLSLSFQPCVLLELMASLVATALVLAVRACGTCAECAVAVLCDPCSLWCAGAEPGRELFGQGVGVRDDEESCRLDVPGVPEGTEVTMRLMLVHVASSLWGVSSTRGVRGCVGTLALWVHGKQDDAWRGASSGVRYGVAWSRAVVWCGVGWCTDILCCRFLCGVVSSHMHIAPTVVAAPMWCIGACRCIWLCRGGWKKCKQGSILGMHGALGLGVVGPGRRLLYGMVNSTP